MKELHHTMSHQTLIILRQQAPRTQTQIFLSPLQSNLPSHTHALLHAVLAILEPTTHCNARGDDLNG